MFLAVNHMLLILQLQAFTVYVPCWFALSLTLIFVYLRLMGFANFYSHFSIVMIRLNKEHTFLIETVDPQLI